MKSDQEFLKEIGERIRELRIKAGYSSYESFAIENDLSRMQYWRMENGQSNMTLKTLKKILDIHKITLEEFIRK